MQETKYLTDTERKHKTVDLPCKYSRYWYIRNSFTLVRIPTSWKFFLIFEACSWERHWLWMVSYNRKAVQLLVADCGEVKEGDMVKGQRGVCVCVMVLKIEPHTVLGTMGLSLVPFTRTNSIHLCLQTVPHFLLVFAGTVCSCGHPGLLLICLRVRSPSLDKCLAHVCRHFVLMWTGPLLICLPTKGRWVHHWTNCSLVSSDTVHLCGRGLKVRFVWCHYHSTLIVHASTIIVRWLLRALILCFWLPFLAKPH